jgi:hypothetical protein
MESPAFDFVIGIGGAAGQGIATPGNILASVFGRPIIQSTALATVLTCYCA